MCSKCYCKCLLMWSISNMYCVVDCKDTGFTTFSTSCCCPCPEKDNNPSKRYLSFNRSTLFSRRSSVLWNCLTEKSGWYPSDSQCYKVGVFLFVTRDVNLSPVHASLRPLCLQWTELTVCCEQRVGRVSQTALNTTAEARILTVLYTCAEEHRYVRILIINILTQRSV